MAININTDYLKFDAASIKSLINKKLSEDPTFTDFIYDGSNLSILIDIFSNMFQVFMYNLNHAASESMFSDTQIYENMNRLVKFIGYNPRGFTPANISVNVGYNSTTQGVIVPPYSYLKLNKNDKNGNPIYYSTVDYYYLYNSSTTNSNIFSLYNGEWTAYNEKFTAQGTPYEKFVLSQLTSDSTDTLNPTYIAYPYIHVYVKRRSLFDSSVYETIRFNPNTDGLFINTADSAIYDSTAKIFNLRLNEYKQYEIQFGDGIHGEALRPNDIVTIVYMNSNGENGQIVSTDIEATSKFKIGITNIDPTSTDAAVLSMEDILYCLFADSLTISDDDDHINPITALGSSSSAINEEGVEDIRNNAPQWFKSFGRIISAKDFDYYIRSHFYNDIIDIKVMNNWEYMTSFYKWLYIKGLSSTNPSPSKYLNNTLYSNYGYKYADAADSNNVYIWLKPKNESTSLITYIRESIAPLKPLTSEPVFIYPIYKEFFPCAAVPTSGYDITDWDNQYDNYIEVELDKTLTSSIDSIKSSIVT